MFGDIEELRCKINIILEDRLLSEKIRQKGTELVFGNAYSDRAKALLNMICN